MIIFLSRQPILVSLLISVGINLFFFLIAFSFKTDQVTDLSYSLSFFVLAPVLLVASGGGFAPQQLVMTLAIMLWGFRLGSYLFARILITKTDDRFDDKRNNPVNLIRFWLLQTIAVWVIMLPFSLFLTNRNMESQSLLMYLGFAIFIIGFVVETISDSQKFQFKRKVENKGKWMQAGLWKYSRHPNYFGEILVWWGLFVVVLPYLQGFLYLSVLGPVFLTILLLFVSGIPLLEKGADKKYGGNPEYISYRDNTSLLIPMPLKSGKG